MNSKTHTRPLRKIIPVFVLALTLPLSSCLDPTTSALLGGGAGAIVGNQIGGGRGAVIGGTVGAIAAYAISKHYHATQAQIRQAEARAASAMRQSSIKNSSRRYVAVPVSKQSGSGRDVIIYDKKTEKVSRDAYVPKAGTKYAKGQEVTVGGKKAVVASAFQGV